MSQKKIFIRKLAKSAISGKIVTLNYAQKHPRTTYIERVLVEIKKQKSK
ncbi:MAG: hypothetical protein G01um101477_453 [Candidatus Doudnabacteria bacterium Gr01-1014_77]|uniref:Uncharacterized protein n=1 Tax=Candidatus Doudnabacteria bacterium Gr01-1014_77 TaxID=2017133 RepID=A0A554JAY6_9BACT|nr:MAG: hypothetical protein G01um101477_453 [Candidatus Doudnabacteria bacterium Gr01-1014_77]